MTSKEVKAVVRKSLGLAPIEENKLTVPVEGHVCEFPLWAFSKKRSTIKELHITYEDGSFFHLDAPKGMPGPSFCGYLDVILFYGQRDLFVREYVEISVYRILKTLEIDATNGGAYAHFHQDMERAFAAFIKTDRFRNPTTGMRSHVRYFRVLQSMELAKSRRDVSTFYFDSLFLASLRSGYLKRLNFDYCLWLDKQNKALSRFMYAHLLKRVGEKGVYTRNFKGFLRDIGLGHVAELETKRRNETLKETVFPALDVLKGEAIRSYEFDDQGNIFFIPKD